MLQELLFPSRLQQTIFKAFVDSFTLGMLGIFSCFCCCLQTFFQIYLTFSKKSNSLDPDQDQHYVSPDLGSNTLQRLSADNKSHC